MKHLCGQCDKVAVWYYVPSSEWWTEKSRYLCEDHINPHRGCSCNINPESGEQDKDEVGRLLPCIEFDYNKDGFENED